MRIDLKLFKKQIEKYVLDYYRLKDKPMIEEFPQDLEWLLSMVTSIVEYNIAKIELDQMRHIDIYEKKTDYKSGESHKKCILKKGYEIESRLGDYSDKFILKGQMAAKVKRIHHFEYKQMNQMKTMINNEFKICKKAETLGFGPKTFDTFICHNREKSISYKVIVTEFIDGKSLEDWLNGNPSVKERKKITKMVKAKIDKMHENGIIHGSLYASNIILKIVKDKIVDAFITDFVRAYDVSDKSTWDYNKWIQDDRNVLKQITNMGVYSWTHTQDVVNYVASKLVANRDIVIT